MTKPVGQFSRVGQTYIDPNEGTERTFRDVNELLATLEKNNALNSPMGNELKILQQASNETGIPLQTLYEFREATSGPLRDQNAHLFQGQDVQALDNALGSLATLRPSGGGGLFGSLSRAAGSALGSVSENVIDPYAQTMRDNPALFFGAPLAVGAISSAITGAPLFGGGAGTATGAATGAKAAPTATQLGTTPAIKAAPVKAAAGAAGPVAGAAGPTAAGGALSNIGNALSNFGPVIGAGLGLINSNSAPDSQTVTSTNNPPAFALPALKEAIDAARQRYLEGGPEQFPGERVAPFSEDTQTAMDMVRQRALAGSPVLNAAQDNITATLRGDFLSPETNPFLQQTFDNAADLTRNRLTSEFSRAGRDVSAAFPARNIELQHLSANLFGNNYQNERNRQFSALGLAPTLSREDYFGPAQLANIGQTQQDQAQRLIDDQVRRFDFDQNRPEFALNNYLNRTTQAAGNYGNQATTQPLYNDPLSGALGGAILGGALFNRNQGTLGQNLLGGLLT